MPQALAPLAAVAVAALAVLRTGTRYAALLAGMPILWIVDPAHVSLNEGDNHEWPRTRAHGAARAVKRAPRHGRTAAD